MEKDSNTLNLEINDDMNDIQLYDQQFFQKVAKGYK